MTAVTRLLSCCCCFVLFITSSTTWAATPDAEILVEGETYLATFASFGSRQTITGRLAPPPSTVDPRLCHNDSISGVDWDGDVMLIPRGDCSFQRKTYNARQLGAKAVIIYNTLESRYKFNETTGDVLYPMDKRDYECSNGQSMIEDLVLDPPAYNGSVHDPLLTLDSDDNLCLLDNSATCDSRACLVTGPPSNDTGIFQGCCAWDIHMRMGRDYNTSDVSDMVAVFITMRQADVFLELPSDTVVTIQARPYPKFSFSSILLWLLAIFIVAFASWYSAKDYRKATKEWHECIRSAVDRRIQERRERQEAQQEGVLEEDVLPQDETQPESESSLHLSVETPGDYGATTSDEEAAGDSLVDLESPPEPPSAEGDVTAPDLESSSQQQEATSSSEAESSSNHNTDETPDQPQERVATRRAANTSNALELSAWHAVAFIVVASTLLLVLFYFQIYSWVTVLYGIGCSGAMSQLIFSPAYRWISGKVGVLQKCCLAPVTSRTCCDLNHLQWVEVFAVLSAYLVGAMWLYVGFTNDEPSTNAFFWITQDVMGACLSILFLSLLRLGSIKVATILLVAVFIYDIFFVFLSPLIFNGDNVMVTVATSGGPPEASEDFCEKYPHDVQCEGGDPLPLVLAIPRLLDYRGGSSLLGLGDIVLPGLLLAFAARLDEAKRLVGYLVPSMNVKVPAHWYNGYLFPLVIAYAIGLLMANVAVYLMERGQPALLYLVPACLGTMFVVGRNELGELWRGPKVLRVADRLVQYRPDVEELSSSTRTPSAEDPSEIVESLHSQVSQTSTTETGSVRSLL